MSWTTSSIISTVTEQALPADNYMLIYEHGEREQPAAATPLTLSPNPQLGKFERFEAIPNDPEALQSLLREERHSREQSAVPGTWKRISQYYATG